LRFEAEADAMVEPIMFFGIGFLIAGLLTIGAVPLVHARAVRLTMRRLEAATPVSIAEIQADKDRLRAEFAMSTRRLELSVEQMKARTTSQLSELSKKSDAINRMKIELGEKSATIFALESREKTLKDQLRATEEEYAVKTDALHEVQRNLADKEAELARTTEGFNERSVTADSQRVELVALRTQVDVLKNRTQEYERETKEVGERLERERNDAENATKQLSEERGKVENLAARVSDLERQLIAQSTEAEILNRRIQELETRLEEQGRLLAERDYESDRLQAEISSARRAESDVRTDLADTERRHQMTHDTLRSEKSLVEEQLKQAYEERDKLQRDIATMKRDAEAAWAAERVENALLRERINDVAAEVARLAAALEGPGSTIDSMLAEATPRGTTSRESEKVAPSIVAGDEPRGTLADRIRALQAQRTARVTQAG
jgi:DNA repair exonuclease SbcCD ATPase subunit